MNDELWTRVMACKKADTRHRRQPDVVSNDLRNDEVTTLLAVMDFFGASRFDLAQAKFDLEFARFRVFDWLAMAVMGRIACKPATKVLVHSFLKCEGDVDRFIQDLRETDYDVDTSWEEIDLG